MIVVDASVAVKWLLPEAYSQLAQRLLRGRQQLLVPDLIWAEVGNALCKRYRRRELSSEVVRNILRTFQQFPLQVYASNDLLEAAWNLVERFDVTVYDSLYLALALSRNCQLVTADKRFYEAINDSLGDSLLWVEGIR